MQNSEFVALIEKTTLEQYTPSEVKLVAWILTAGSMLGGFPVEISMRDIKEGITRGNVHIPGWGAHYRTIGSAFQSLEERGVLKWAEGSSRGFGYTSKLVTLKA